ncbi:uncharacterized protein At3g28850-like [Carica papaya]|uniref:uncharacterized protein At3g28850-like n=1 Tax=Carica papaya TaxID=3649 RepID=UPI000B8CB936|nr:uncharacterized protein At3g28850-like [Carica papaya]
MGCASSKEKRCRHCRRPYSPVSRSYSMHVHHPAQHSGDSYHVVALTSTTLGSIKLDCINQTNHCIDVPATATTTTTTFNKILNGYDEKKGESNGKLQVEEEKCKLMEAKSWSNMVAEKIPKIIPRTPIRTPPGEPETINAWELMEGLEDVSPFRSPTHQRSFSFDVCRTPADPAKSEYGSASPKPLWLQMTEDDQNSNTDIPEFDPEIISTFRRSLQELPPEHPFYIPVPDCGKKSNGIIISSDFKDKLIVYFTSLRGVRKTYEDCCHVRVILKSLRLRLDERDVSMHSRFKMN